MIQSARRATSRRRLSTGIVGSAAVNIADVFSNNFQRISLKMISLRTRTLNAEIRWQDDVTRPERMRSLPGGGRSFCQ